MMKKFRVWITSYPDNATEREARDWMAAMRAHAKEARALHNGDVVEINARPETATPEVTIRRLGRIGPDGWLVFTDLPR